MLVASEHGLVPSERKRGGAAYGDSPSVRFASVAASSKHSLTGGSSPAVEKHMKQNTNFMNSARQQNRFAAVPSSRNSMSMLNEKKTHKLLEGTTETVATFTQSAYSLSMQQLSKIERTSKR